MAANLSDVAAMGARPVLAVVALGLPPGSDAEWVLECYRGLDALARRHGARVVRRRHRARARDHVRDHGDRRGQPDAAQDAGGRAARRRARAHRSARREPGGARAARRRRRRGGRRTRCRAARARDAGAAARRGPLVRGVGQRARDDGLFRRFVDGRGAAGACVEPRRRHRRRAGRCRRPRCGERLRRRPAPLCARRRRGLRTAWSRSRRARSRTSRERSRGVSVARFCGSACCAPARA